MNIRELTTWQRLCKLDLDVSDVALPFAARLARDNGWSAPFAERAIEEYRKFCFLAVHAGHPVTPSDEVDQVWHQHLLYSRHYWETLCRDTLEMPLHHGPTQRRLRRRPQVSRLVRRHARFLSALFRRAAEGPVARVGRTVSMSVTTSFASIAATSSRVDRALLRRGAIASLFGGGGLAMAHALAQVDAAATPRSSVGFWLVLVAVVLVIAIAVAASRATRARKRHKGTAAAATGGAGCGSASKASCDDGGATDGGGSGCGSAGGCGGGGCGGGS